MLSLFNIKINPANLLINIGRSAVQTHHSGSEFAQAGLEQSLFKYKRQNLFFKIFGNILDVGFKKKRHVVLLSAFSYFQNLPGYMCTFRFLGKDTSENSMIDNNFGISGHVTDYSF